MSKEYFWCPFPHSHFSFLGPCNKHAIFNMKTSISTVRPGTLREQKRVGNKIKMPKGSPEVNYVQGKNNSSNISVQVNFRRKSHSKPELCNIEQNEEWKGFYAKNVSHSAT